MKLKKLLPIASLAGVAAVVAPLVTSCGTKTYVYEFDKHNPAREFKPENQIPVTDKKMVWSYAATTEYLKDVEKNKRILADDLVWSAIYANYVEDLSYGKAAVKVGNIDSETKKCSFEFDIDIESLKNKNSRQADDPSRVLNRYTLEFKNVEMILVYDYDSWLDEWNWQLEPLAVQVARGLGVQAALAYLRSNDDWSIKIGQKINIAGQTRNVEITLDSNSTEDQFQILMSAAEAGILIFPDIYYFENVTLRDSGGR